MIKTTGIDSMRTIKQICPQGWIMDYVEAVKCARFPLSFHLLNGLFALGAIVGRSTYLPRSGYTLYPPVWVLLLGTSGVGKGKSMALAKKVLGYAREEGGYPFLIYNPDTFTRRGLIRACQDHIRGEGPDDPELTEVEGAVLVDEISAVLKARTGTDTNIQFFIKASDMDSIEDMTGYLGQVNVQGFTVGILANSTIELLRESVSASAFSGGFMHRFFCAHELMKPNTEEANPPESTLRALATAANMIRENAPPVMMVESDASRLLRTISRRSELSRFPDAHLAGFWNRYEGMCAKVSMLYALSQNRHTITLHDVRLSELLVQGHLYKPLRELVTELSFGPAKQALVKAADDLYFAGPGGISQMEFVKKIPAATKQQVRDQLRFLIDHKMVYTGTGPDSKPWLWRLPQWIGHYEDVHLPEQSEIE